ncbi:MAG TPA: calcium-binding protein, partial [Caulobacteraceae bacterium]|nr:calcium-binding protein [Caulobacteraceae bacterium]
SFVSIERFQLSNFNDTFFGSAADEQVDGFNGLDTLNGGDGADNLKGMNGNDTLNGDDGNDVLNGGANNDTIDGGAGQDRIYGDKGNDTLTGGADNDQFVFIGGATGTDVITDFENGADKIRLFSTSADDYSDLAIADNGSGGVTITLPDGSVITLQNTLYADMDASDFGFG